MTRAPQGERLFHVNKPVRRNGGGPFPLVPGGAVKRASPAGRSYTDSLSESAIKVAIHRLRKRFREVIRAEIAQTIDESGEVDAELRYLVEVLARR